VPALPGGAGVRGWRHLAVVPAFIRSRVRRRLRRQRCFVCRRRLPFPATARFCSEQCRRYWNDVLRRW
jgi:hypothetical protein